MDSNIRSYKMLHDLNALKSNFFFFFCFFFCISKLTRNFAEQNCTCRHFHVKDVFSCLTKQRHLNSDAKSKHQGMTLNYDKVKGSKDL